MSTNLVGVILIIFGIYQYSTLQNKEILEALKAVGVSVFGAAYIMYNNATLIKSTLLNFLATFFKKKVSLPSPELKNIVAETTFNYIKDTEAIQYLKQRCVAANSTDGVETCRILSDIIFKLDIPKQVESGVKNVKKSR